MVPKHLQLLQCISCRGDRTFRLEAASTAGEDVLTGKLVCSACGAVHDVVDGVPRFVPPDQDYCANFGFQWQRWKEIQIDRLGKHHLSEGRFFAEVPWDRPWMAGKTILDCGCGAGRFADVAAAHAGTVVACDISGAIDAAREVTRAHGDKVLCVQASIYDLPFANGTFDGLYCLGVIQHTPDPRKAMLAMPRVLKPGGRLAYDFYQKTRWEKPFVPRWFLRKYTPDWPVERTLLLSQMLTAGLFPLAAIVAKTPVLNQLSPALPIAISVEPQFTWRQRYIMTLLDTFDFYGPRHEIRQDFREVARLLRDAGMQDIVAIPGVVTAAAPGD